MAEEEVVPELNAKLSANAFQQFPLSPCSPMDNAIVPLIS